MTEQTRPSDMTLWVITKPLRDALRDNKINEDSVMSQLSTILSKASSRDQDKIRIAELFVKWLGITENININVNEIDAALEALEQKQKKRKKANDIKAAPESPNTETK